MLALRNPYFHFVYKEPISGIANNFHYIVCWKMIQGQYANPYKRKLPGGYLHFVYIGLRFPSFISAFHSIL